MSTSQPEDIQAEYYRRTAADYDSMHVDQNDEHARALRIISHLVREHDIKSILDVGAGTGRAVKHFLTNHKDVTVRGIEPVPALRDQAVARHNIPPELIEVGRGEQLPFASQSIDAVCEFGVLHHVRRPADVVREMLRVAQKAIFLSDSNRFGQGSRLARWVKLLAYKTGFWQPVNLINTRGRGYHLSEGDGLSYSYSVYDNYDLIARWARQVVLIPSFPHSDRTWLTPLLTSGHVVLCAFR
jgi:SAM-dependent methyltransferase